MSDIAEANFDGLVGPTHNYAGLSHGNLASTSHGGAVASPREAALQGIQKMRALAALGLVQGVLPPHERPDVRWLRRIGFAADTDADVIARAHRADPTLLAIASSASAMWTANAATVAPSIDTRDRRLAFVPANLVDKAHRAIEPVTTGRVLRAIFDHEDHFRVHAALPRAVSFGDEGAANHTRFDGGVHLFVYGREALRPDMAAPRRFPARQTLEASQAVARLLSLDPARCVFAQQHPDVIDRGVFHNDVIAVGHERTLFVHEQAFLDRDATYAALRERVPGLEVVEVAAADVSVEDAVRSYLFNSQLVRPRGRARPILIAPAECREVAAVAAWLDANVGPGRPIEEVLTHDLRESMNNGGGPACLRLRVPLTEQERGLVAPGCLMDDAGFDALEAWVRARYRDRLTADDLADPALLEESRVALDELTGMLGIGSVYPFQRV